MPTNPHRASKSHISPQQIWEIGEATSVFLNDSSRLCCNLLKINGFWIHDLTIEIIGKGTVADTTSSGGEGIAPLTNVQLDLHPELVEVLNTIEENRVQIAVEHPQIIKDRSRTAWLQQFLNWKPSVLFARSVLKVAVVEYYIDLVRYFLLGNTLPNGLDQITPKQNRNIQNTMSVCSC